MPGPSRPHSTVHRPIEFTDIQTIHSEKRLPVEPESVHHPHYPLPQTYYKDAFFHDMKIELMPFFPSTKSTGDTSMFKVGLYELQVFTKEMTDPVLEKDFFAHDSDDSHDSDDPLHHHFRMEGNTVKDPRSMNSNIIEPVTLWNRIRSPHHGKRR